MTSGDASVYGAEQNMVNADRIVACVNACRGIPTEELLNRVFVHFVGTETRCYSLEDGE